MLLEQAVAEAVADKIQVVAVEMVDQAEQAVKVAVLLSL